MGAPPPPNERASRSPTYHRVRRSRKPAFLALGVALGAWAIARWRPFRFEVSGGSMEPALRDGDWAIAVTRGRPRPGSVVVVEHPERPGFEMAKRVTALEGGLTPGGRALGPGELWVEGDNAGGSTDSRDFGPVRSEQVRGIVVAVWWPPKRWRVL